MADLKRPKRIVSAETRRKISEAMKGRTLSAETREKLSAAHKGKHRGPVSEETRRRMSDAHAGKARSEETKRKISASRKGKLHSEETKRKMALSQSKRDRSYMQKGRHPSAKRINQLTRDGELVRTWECMQDIADDPRFPSKYKIRKCCMNSSELYNGFRWEYADPGKERKIRQLTLDGDLVRIWDRMRDIEDDPQFASTNLIRECCLGNKESYYGYRWEYADDEKRDLQPPRSAE